MVAAACVVVLAAILIVHPDDGGNGDVTVPDTGDRVTSDSIFAGPTYDPTMGYVTVTSFDNDSITFTVTAADGYRFVHWEDLDGNVLTTSTSMTFPSIGDRDARAVFGVSGPRTVDIQWYSPVFNSDGSVTDGDPIRFSVVLDDVEYEASVSDASVQRHGTVANLTPGALCTVDGVMASVVDHIDVLTQGMTNLQKAIVILQFVQDAVGYQLDRDQYGSEEFWATPFETLYSGYGDCEDTAVLYASIATALGLDVGFVMFESDRLDTPDSGHLSVAVALKGTESIGGDATTFELDGATWAYAETAFDMTDEGDYRPLVGVLSTNYTIHHASFTPVLFEDGTFRSGKTIYIHSGATSASGTMVYGSDSNPPAVEMGIGDTFSYNPVTSLPSVITASGNGMQWLTWDSTTNTLSGTATISGTWEVALTATSTVGPEQTAVQNVIIIVKDSTGSSDHTLVYGEQGWAVEVTGDIGSGSVDHHDSIVIGILLGLAVLLGGFFVVRVI